MPPPLDTAQKAFQLNLNNTIYGTLAEIGAGQEVARWLFRVGGAAGTIAKTISAYDMQYSDAIYGPTQRYVSRQRLNTMLQHEYNLLLQRLDPTRGTQTRFFAFANTVAAKSYQRAHNPHGWLGIRFQHQPRAQPSQAIIHTRMLDPQNQQQQDTLGIVGINLIHAATLLNHKPHTLIPSLMDNLTPARIEIDMLKLTGPAFNHIDNRLTALNLLQQGATRAAMFTANGETIQPAEILHNRPLLLQRGAFRPPTNLHIHMLQSAQKQFQKQHPQPMQPPLTLFEMNMKQLTTTHGDTLSINPKDFLDRADILAPLGHPILISNYYRYFRLADYLFRYTNQPIALILGLPNLHDLFNQKYYTDLPGGILESFGRIFKNDLKIYTYPTRCPKTNQLLTADNFQPPKHLQHLYTHLHQNQRIQPLHQYNNQTLTLNHHQIRQNILQNNNQWEQHLPPQIVHQIKTRHAFGFNTQPTNQTKTKQNPTPQKPN